ncbi:MAG: hypothetical protein GY807_20520 [Gammaproteobacteria bacterium]|nr:hypothetical protein [Gammaproteobacteria bacterium]
MSDDLLNSDLGGGNGGGGSTDPTVPQGQTIQPALPGHLDALAQQLNAGYGGSPVGQQSTMDYLNSMYAPMQMMDNEALQQILAGGANANANGIGNQLSNSEFGPWVQDIFGEIGNMTQGGLPAPFNGWGS